MNIWPAWSLPEPRRFWRAESGSNNLVWYAELVVACSWWSFFLLGTGKEWPVIEALGRGYTRRSGLASVEIAALPDLFRLRLMASLIHRLGRREAGLETEGAIEERVDDTLRWERWLDSHQERLVNYAQEWR